MSRKRPIDRAIESLRCKSPQTWTELLESIGGDQSTKNEIRSCWASKAFLIADRGHDVDLLTVDEALEAEIARKRLKYLNTQLKPLLKEIHEFADRLRKSNSGYNMESVREPVGADLRGADLTYAKTNAKTKWLKECP